MTRLSEALQKAASDPALPPPPGAAQLRATSIEPPATEWKFSPVETMHVPDEPPALDVASDPPSAAPSRPVETKPLAVGTDRHKLIVGEAVNVGLIEQYRHLAAVLHHAQKQSNVHSVMVTSALPAEGKTLTATNLALTLSESYQRR